MQVFLNISFILLFWALALPCARADEIIMTSGERFTADHIRVEGEKIRFSMQGLVVSVHKDEVASILRANGEPMPLATPAPPPGPIQSSEPAPAPVPSPGVNAAAQTPSPVRPIRLPWSTTEGPRPSPTPPPAAARRMVEGTGLTQATWGMAPDALPGLKKLKTDPIYGGVDQYWLPDQRLRFGEALLDGWVYNFWQDRLYSIIMWAEGRIGYERMKNEIFARYGKGVQRRPEVERFVWEDAQSQRMLEYDERSQAGIFVMRSSEVDQQIKARYPAVPPSNDTPH